MNEKQSKTHVNVQNGLQHIAPPLTRLSGNYFRRLKLKCKHLGPRRNTIFSRVSATL